MFSRSIHRLASPSNPPALLPFWLTISLIMDVLYTNVKKLQTLASHFVSTHHLMPWNEHLLPPWLLQSKPMHRNDSNLNDGDRYEEKDKNGRKWL